MTTKRGYLGSEHRVIHRRRHQELSDPTLTLWGNDYEPPIARASACIACHPFGQYCRHQTTQSTLLLFPDVSMTNVCLFVCFFTCSPMPKSWMSGWRRLSHLGMNFILVRGKHFRVPLTWSQDLLLYAACPTSFFTTWQLFYTSCYRSYCVWLHLVF